MSHKSDSNVGYKSIFESTVCLENYIVLNKLGVGSYAAVYKACKVNDKSEFVAIKCFERSKLLCSNGVDSMVNEIKMLKMLKHPNIVHMNEFLWDERFVFIIEEFCDGGDLSHYIQKRVKIPEKIFQMFLKQLSLGLSYLRSFNICHLDLKPSNLLIVTKPQMTLKIGDFGFSQFLSNETNQGALRGSPLYMAPEMLLRRQYDAKVDLWSVGIIAYECLFGKAPFASYNFKELQDKLIAETPIEIPEDCNLSRQCQELLRRLLKYDPNERIDYEQFFAHPFVDIAHQPSKKTYDYAVSLIHEAVKYDANREFKKAFNLYCDALAYLIPHAQAEKDEVRKKALQKRMIEFMNRAEAILPGLKVKPDSSNVRSSVQDLDFMCSSTPQLQTAIDILKTGDLFFADAMYDKAIEKYQIGIEILMGLIPKEPPGIRKEALLRQTNEWVAQATRAKALHDLGDLQNNHQCDEAEAVKGACVLQ